MSHFSQVKTKLTNALMLKRALKAMKFQVEEAAEGVEVRGFFGASSRAEFKVLTKTHYDIGFAKKEDGTYEIVGDWEILPKASGIKQEEFMNQVKREYAKASIVDMAMQKGMEVECNETGESVEMVVTQW